MSTRPPILAVTGLKREAALLAAPGVVIVAGGGDGEGLARALEAAFHAEQLRAVVSVGLGGALAPVLAVGDWVVAERIVRGGQVWETDLRWTRTLEAGLVRALSPPLHSEGGGEADEGGGAAAPFGRSSPSAVRPLHPATQGPPPPLRGGGVHIGAIAASDVMVVDAAAKAALYASTEALAVDMESHVAAAFAAEYGLPFAALRVISDRADRALPKAAQAGMKKDGGMDVLAVLKALARDPRQFPALIRTGREAEVAFRQLKLLNRHDLLGRLGVGDPDLGQLALDVV